MENSCFSGLSGLLRLIQLKKAQREKSPIKPTGGLLTTSKKKRLSNHGVGLDKSGPFLLIVTVQIKS
jgi:hypothetical protein